MSYTTHNAFVITSFDEKTIQQAIGAAKALGMKVCGPVDSYVNEYYTVFIGPDGSKEGWVESDEGDRDRKKMRDFLESHCTLCEWVEVAYGDLTDGDSGAEVVHNKWRTGVNDEPKEDEDAE